MVQRSIIKLLNMNQCTVQRDKLFIKKIMRTLTKEMQTQLIPAKAIELLKDGNKRFVNNLKINRNLLQQINETSDGQYPFAFILSCIDSRTSAELIFDQGLGDILLSYCRKYSK